MSRDEIAHLVDRHHFQRPQRGVYRTGSKLPDWEDRVLEACLAAGGDARAMGRTAARVHGLDGAERHSVIELSVGVGRGPTPKGVIIRRTRQTDPSLRTRFNGIPVSSINATLLEYAWLGTPLLVERGSRGAFRRGRTSEGPLRRFVATRGKGVEGVTTLRAVLDGRPEGRPARSGFEVIVLDILREFGLPLPLRRPLVSVPPDRKFECDLAYMDELIDIEPMGKKWHSTRRQLRDDAERRDVLGAFGWQIVPVLWEEAVFTPAVTAARVRAALSARS